MDGQDLFQFPNSMVLIVPDRESFIKMSHWNIAFLVLGKGLHLEMSSVSQLVYRPVSNWINRVDLREDTHKLHWGVLVGRFSGGLLSWRYIWLLWWELCCKFGLFYWHWKDIREFKGWAMGQRPFVLCQENMSENIVWIFFCVYKFKGLL